MAGFFVLRLVTCCVTGRQGIIDLFGCAILCCGVVWCDVVLIVSWLGLYGLVYICMC